MSTREQKIQEYADKLKEFDSRIDEFQNKAKNAPDTLKEKYRGIVTDLNEKRNLLKDAFLEIGDATEKAIAEAEIGFKNAYAALKDSLSKAASEFK